MRPVRVTEGVFETGFLAHLDWGRQMRPCLTEAVCRRALGDRDRVLEFSAGLGR